MHIQTRAQGAQRHACKSQGYAFAQHTDTRARHNKHAYAAHRHACTTQQKHACAIVSFYVIKLIHIGEGQVFLWGREGEAEGHASSGMEMEVGVRPAAEWLKLGRRVSLNAVRPTTTTPGTRPLIIVRSFERIFALG